MSDTCLLYTDGACRGNPGPGGWAALIESPSRTLSLRGADPATTNNRMEMMAAIRGLEALVTPSSVRLCSDSRYLIQGVSEWMPAWKKRGWLTADRKPVKNRDLWERLDLLCSRHRVEWQWVRGHNGDPRNERVDRLANLAIDALLAGQPCEVEEGG